MAAQANAVLAIARLLVRRLVAMKCERNMVNMLGLATLMTFLNEILNHDERPTGIDIEHDGQDQVELHIARCTFAFQYS